MTKWNLYEIVSVYGTHGEYVSAAYVKELDVEGYIKNEW